MNTSDNDFPLAIGDRVRIISKTALYSYGKDGVVVELQDEFMPYLIQLIDRPLSDEYPQNPGYYARHALCFLAPKTIA